MNNIFEYILQTIFSITGRIESIQEDCDEVYCEYNGTLVKISYNQDCETILNTFNTRDVLSITVLQNEDVIAVFKSDGESSIKTFIEEVVNNGIGSSDAIEVTIKQRIIKHVENYTRSIYFTDAFVEYLNRLSLLSFLSVFNNRFENSKLVFELQNSEPCQFYTNSISFTTRDDISNLHLTPVNKRTELIDRANFLCHFDGLKYNLLPNDLYPLYSDTITNTLGNVFKKVCVLYTCSFLFDYTTITKDQFSYRLNGFKTFNYNIATNTLNNTNVDVLSVDTLYEIYRWAYSGGNTNDKLNIARNIISLNIKPQILSIESSTFDAIQSNFRIYEKENVRQYIQVRNKLSELLIDLQVKIGNIVDGFTGDFRKNIITLLSFFITVIVVRVVSKGDFIGGFTNEILLVVFILLLISIGLLLYSRWELNRKVSLFEKHYNQLKNRYKDLLSPRELEEIFEDCDPNKTDNNVSFVQQQKALYTKLWALSIVLFFVAFIIILVINNQEIISKFIENVIQRIYNYTGCDIA